MKFVFIQIIWSGLKSLLTGGLRKNPDFKFDKRGARGSFSV